MSELMKLEATLPSSSLKTNLSLNRWKVDMTEVSWTYLCLC